MKGQADEGEQISIWRALVRLASAEKETQLPLKTPSRRSNLRRACGILASIQHQDISHRSEALHAKP